MKRETGVVIMGSLPEKLRIEMRQVGEKGRESSSCSSDFLISEATRQEEEQSPSSTEDFTHSPVSSRWSVKNVDGDKRKILPDSLEPSTVSGSSTKCSLLFLTDTFRIKVRSFD